MKRRQFFAIPALTVLPLGISADVASAESDVFMEYSREAYEQALASGEPFMLDFYAKW